MDNQKAITVLKNLLNKNSLNEEEKEAVFAAIGLLSWVSLSKSRIQAIKNKREGSINGKP